MKMSTTFSSLDSIHQSMRSKEMQDSLIKSADDALTKHIIDFEEAKKFTREKMNAAIKTPRTMLYNEPLRYDNPTILINKLRKDYSGYMVYVPDDTPREGYCLGIQVINVNGEKYIIANAVGLDYPLRVLKDFHDTVPYEQIEEIYNSAVPEFSVYTPEKEE